MDRDRMRKTLKRQTYA